jgi:putative aldouronate transport system substrate-binding protein
MKKALALFLCLAAMLALCAAPALAADTDYAELAAQDANFNPTGFPIVKEPVSKTVMIRRPGNIAEPAEMATLQYIQELTGIDIEWVVVSADGWNERVNLTFASADLPDIIMKGGIPNLSRVIEDEQLVALDTLIAAYSEGVKPLLEQYPGVDASARSADGKIYTMPGINTLLPNLTAHRNLWINQAWLSNLGLATPTTTDELLDVMRAIRDGDPDGDGDAGNEIPYAVEDSGAGHTARPDIIAGLFGLYSNFGYDNTQLVGGKVSFLKTDPVWKDVLAYMNVLYTEGLLDNEVFTQTGDMSIGKISTGKIGVFGLSSDDLFSAVNQDYVALAPVKSPSGLDPVIALSANSMGNNTFITEADESPWVSFRLLDYFFTYEGSMTIGCFNDALVGVTCQKLEDGTWDYSEAMVSDERGVAVAVGEACPLPGGGFGYWRQADNSNYIYSKKVQENVPVWELYYQKTPVYGAPQFGVDDSDTLNEIKSDLDTYVLECQAKFITGEMSLDKWDEYVSTVAQLRGDDLVAIYQAYYDTLGN